MKAIKFKTLLLIVVFGIAITTSVTAQVNKVEKKYHKEYSVTADSRLYLENKYGDIDVRNWGKNQVVIDVVITVKHRDRERADKLLSFLDVEFSQEGDEIKPVDFSNFSFTVTKIDFIAWFCLAPRELIDFQVSIFHINIYMPG